MVAPSIASGDGSQRSSARAALAPVGAIAAPLSPRRAAAEGGLAVEPLAARANEGAHPLPQALLSAGQEDPDVEVLRRLGVELLGEREGRGNPRGVVVGTGDDLR